MSTSTKLSEYEAEQIWTAVLLSWINTCIKYDVKELTPKTLIAIINKYERDIPEYQYFNENISVRDVENYIIHFYPKMVLSPFVSKRDPKKLFLLTTVLLFHSLLHSQTRKVDFDITCLLSEDDQYIILRFCETLRDTDLTIANIKYAIKAACQSLNQSPSSIATTTRKLSRYEKSFAFIANSSPIKRMKVREISEFHKLRATLLENSKAWNPEKVEKVIDYELNDKSDNSQLNQYENPFDKVIYKPKQKSKSETNCRKQVKKQTHNKLKNTKILTTRSGNIKITNRSESSATSFVNVEDTSSIESNCEMERKTRSESYLNGKPITQKVLQYSEYVFATRSAPIPKSEELVKSDLFKYNSLDFIPFTLREGLEDEFEIEYSSVFLSNRSFHVGKLSSPKVSVNSRSNKIEKKSKPISNVNELRKKKNTSSDQLVTPIVLEANRGVKKYNKKKRVRILINDPEGSPMVIESIRISETAKPKKPAKSSKPESSTKTNTGITKAPTTKKKPTKSVTKAVTICEDTDHDARIAKKKKSTKSKRKTDQLSKSIAIKAIAEEKEPKASMTVEESKSEKVMLVNKLETLKKLVTDYLTQQKPMALVEDLELLQKPPLDKPVLPLPEPMPELIDIVSAPPPIEIVDKSNRLKMVVSGDISTALGGLQKVCLPDCNCRRCQDKKQLIITESEGMLSTVKRAWYRWFFVNIGIVPSTTATSRKSNERSKAMHTRQEENVYMPTFLESQRGS